MGGLDKEGRPADTRTEAQREALIRLVEDLRLVYPDIRQVIGHRDTSPDRNGDGIISPNEFIKISRLKKAAELILQGDMRIYEIAEAVGFNSQSYFSRAFSKQFNMSPSQYAKENNIELK